MKLTESTTENLSADDQKLIAMIAGLPRAAAPADFDLRLKGRLARAASVNGSWATGGGLPLWARFALPTVLSAAALTYFLLPLGYNYPETASDANPTVAAEKSSPVVASKVPSETANQILPVSPPEEAIAATRPTNAETENVQRVAPVTAPRPPDLGKTESAVAVGGAPIKNLEEAAPTGGSVDRALRGSSNTILPRGLDTSPATDVRPGDVGNAARIGIVDVFSLLGINAEFANGWLVRGVRPGGLAQRAGVKPGDVVVAVDGAAAARDMTFTGTFNARMLTVRRAGQTIRVSLQNR